jgi:hypothetical protein
MADLDNLLEGNKGPVEGNLDMVLALGKAEDKGQERK